jgi:predicted transposase YbfD/YdcC
VTIDAMGCQVAIADKVVEHKADYLLALKGHQPTLEAEVADYFNSAPAEELVVKDAEIENGHGRIEMRTYTASSNVDWIVSDRSYPGEPRFTNIKTLVNASSRVEYADRCTFETGFYISSAPLDIDRLAGGARGHWGIESTHWLLDVAFKDDLSRYRGQSRRQEHGHRASLRARSRPCQQVQVQRQNTQKISRLGHVLFARTAAA